MEEKVFVPNKYKSIPLIVVSLVFVYLGVIMISEKPLQGWLTSVFFGICLLVFVIQLFPGSTQLKLTPEGFVMTSLFRSHLIRWKDVTRFRTGYLFFTKTVFFNYSERKYQQHSAIKLSKIIAGSDNALPSTYGVKASELAAILNEWKKKYGNEVGSTN